MVDGSIPSRATKKKENNNLKLCYDTVEIIVARIKIGGVWYHAKHVRSLLDSIIEGCDNIFCKEDANIISCLVKNKVISAIGRPEGVVLRAGLKFSEFYDEVGEICKLDDGVNIMDYPEEDDNEDVDYDIE